MRAQYEKEPLKPIEHISEFGPNPDPVSIPVCAPAPDPSDETTALTGAIAWLDGQYNGCQFPVDPGKEVIIGRDPSVSNIVIDGNILPSASAIAVFVLTPLVDCTR
mgnify:CR=1 FL=1